jgi:fucose 4-O-acetylase-like acetyltransferase
LWDNARFLAITLVVLGHALTKTTAATDSAYVLYTVIYLFHIPLRISLRVLFFRRCSNTEETAERSG